MKEEEEVGEEEVGEEEVGEEVGVEVHVEVMECGVWSVECSVRVVYV